MIFPPSVARLLGDLRHRQRKATVLFILACQTVVENREDGPREEKAGGALTV